MEHGGGLSVAEQGGALGPGRFMAAAAASGGPSLGFLGGAAAFSFQFMPAGGKMETARWGGPVVKKL